MYSTTVINSPGSKISELSSRIATTMSNYSYRYQHRTHLNQIQNSCQNLILSSVKHRKDCCQKRKKKLLNSFER